MKHIQKIVSIIVIAVMIATSVDIVTLAAGAEKLFGVSGNEILLEEEETVCENASAQVSDNSSDEESDVSGNNEEHRAEKLDVDESVSTNDNSMVSSGNVEQVNEIELYSKDSFGDLVIREFDEKQAEQEENLGYNIFSVEVSGFEATVSLETLDDCTVVVAIYDEAGKKMLATGRKEVCAGETSVVVDIDSTSMPEYFYLRGFLVDSDNLRPMCTAYESPNYTKEMQEFFAKTTDDFDADRVLNLDEDKTNNFAVFSEETKIIETDGTTNEVVVADDDKNTYIIENVDEYIISLVAGDIFAFEYTEGEFIIVKVDSITIEGTTATIIGAETSLEEVFEYVKIDVSADVDDAVIDDTECIEGVRYEGLIEDSAEESQKYSTSIRAIDKENSVSKSISMKFDALKVGTENANAKITGGVDLKLENSVKLYVSFSYQYVEIKFEYSAKIKASISGTLKGEIPLVEVKFQPIPAIVIQITPSIVVEFSSKIELSGKLSGSVGFSASSDEGIKNLSKSPEFETTLKGEITCFIGIELEPLIAIVDEHIVYAGLSATVGVEAKAGITYYESKPSSSETHDCGACLDGDLSAKEELEFSAQLLNWDKLKFSRKIEFSQKIADFYYSISADEFGWGTCPYIKYKVAVSVRDENGNPIECATVNDKYITNSDGITSFYLPNGRHNIKVSKDIFVGEKEIEIKDNSKSILIQCKEVVIASGACNDTVFWSISGKDDNLTLTISGKGIMPDYRYQEPRPWGNYRAGIKKIVVKEGITQIGKYAFFRHENAVSLEIADSVLILNSNVCEACSSLETVDFGEGIKEIGIGAFWKCGNLSTLDLPNSIVQMEGSAFKQTGVKTFITPSNLTFVSNELLNHSALTEVTISDGVTAIDSLAFANCEKLQKVTISKTVTVIADNAFENTPIRDVFFQGTKEEWDASFSTTIAFNVGTIIHFKDGTTATIDIKKGAVEFNGHYYRLINVPKEWGDAKAYCEELGGYLAAITSAEEDAFLYSLCKNAGVSNAWFGLLYEDEKWRWLSGEAFVYTNWGDGEPSYDGPYGMYYSKYKNGKWNDGRGESQAFICEWGEVSKQDNFDMQVDIDNQKIKVYDSDLTKGEDKKYYNNLEGYLSTAITSEEKTAVIEKYFKNLLSNEVYNIYVMKSRDSEESLLQSDNLLYMNQFLSDSDGRIDFYCELEEAYENPEIFVVGMTGKDLCNVEISILNLKYDGSEQFVKPDVVYNGVKLVEGKDYELRGDFSAIDVGKYDLIIWGIGEFYGKQEISYYVWSDRTEVLPDDIPDGANPTDDIPEGLWLAEISAQIYTGKKITPEVHVYHGETLLKKDKDYTITYKRNKNANDATSEATAPTIIIKGIGNYSDRETATFVIAKKDIASADINVSDMTVKKKDKVQKKVPTLTYNGKSLVKGTDFEVSYPDETRTDVEEPYKSPGTYKITVKGIGNFDGERTVLLTITDETLLNKATLKNVKKQPYQYGAEVKLPNLEVRLNGAKLKEGYDYDVTYENNFEVGTATVIVTGKGDYAGTKKATFKIFGTSLKNATVRLAGMESGAFNKDGIANRVYDGTEQTHDIVVTLQGNTLIPDEDYEVIYTNNVDAGKATMTVKGINAYTGKVKKTFQIMPYNLESDERDLITGLPETIEVQQIVKGGSMLDMKLAFGITELIEGTDYTVTYKNNKTVTTDKTKKLPTIIIKGKGNFTGTYSQTFIITGKALDDENAPVKMNVENVGYTAKKGNYISKPILTDVDGKVLKEGTDYKKKLVYTLEDGTILNEKSKVQANTTIIVSVEGKGNYSGTLKATYQVMPKNFKNAHIKINPQTYTGKEITLTKEDIIVTFGSEEILLSLNEQYEIVDGSYKKNVNYGKAQVTFRGLGEYGGTQTVKFRIGTRPFEWFWRLFE